MKKIGILFGQENSFPQAFVDKINSKCADANENIIAEFVKIDKVIQGSPCDYDVSLTGFHRTFRSIAGF